MNIINYRTFEVNLGKCFTYGNLLRHFTDVFQLPGSFGSNLNAMNDGMRDLSWFLDEEENYKIVLNNKKGLLKKNPKMLDEIIELFEMYKEYWDNENKGNPTKYNYLIEIQ